MTRVVAIILHAVPLESAGPLESAFMVARFENAQRLAAGFTAAGSEVRLVETTAGSPTFGARLRHATEAEPGSGLIMLGSGSLPLARTSDFRAFVDAASRTGGPALANNRYSADVIALPPHVDLRELPDLGADNGLPRWLAAHGQQVSDLGARWRLGVDLDSPLDALIVDGWRSGDALATRVRGVAQRVVARAGDRSAELIVAGRTSAATLRWLETHTRSRTRALVEERGMRTAAAGQRPARSVLGWLLDREGPGALGWLLAELGDAAVVDTRVLLAHRLGREEAGWPTAEDRFASDLLLHERIEDPWLRDLTAAAATAPIPIMLGGHTLVGPGLRLLLRGAA